MQDKTKLNRKAALGIAVRHFQIGREEADYLLIIDGKAAGIIEAKKAGITLSGVAEQSESYATSDLGFMKSWGTPLPFAYETSAEETLFRDNRDPVPRSRHVFAFHKPKTLHRWLKADETFRAKLAKMPPLDQAGLRDCQEDAIEGLETSLSYDRPRSLIQMATGAGKTFTACSFSWRLLKHAKAQRILFLVDRANLGAQTLKEFQNFTPPSTNQKFTDVYVTQHLRSNVIDPDAKVVITTIQRLYSMLRGEELDPEAEETSDFEIWEDEGGAVPPIGYNPDLPIETFDIIVTDECHRSIYGLWRQVLEYFDAHMIGLTATPGKHTLGFFGKNLVAEYPYERSVADGVNVGYEVFRIKTEIGERGGLIDAGYDVPVMDKRTRAKRYEALDEDLEFTPGDLDRSVTARNQIHTVLETYRDRLFTDLFPGRSGKWVPKTLIFAKDDNHAEEIVMAAREVFDAGNDFAKKITYRVSGETPASLISAFRNDINPRIAVTVDMIATGTDIKPVEAIIFMRDVKSESYFEQMKGRGVRTIDDTQLATVTPDAQTKTRFVLIDAVGVTEGKKNASQPLERQRTVGFEKLLEQIAQGRRDDAAISSLVARLAAMSRQLNDADHAQIAEAAGDTLAAITGRLLTAIEPDEIERRTKAAHGPDYTPEQFDAVTEAMIEDACEPFDNPDLRRLLVELKTRADIVINEINEDRTILAEFDMEAAQKTVSSFEDFIAENRDEITALQILYSQHIGKQRLTYAQIRDLTRALTDAPPYLRTADVWQAYTRLRAAEVRGAPVDRLLTEIIALVRYALGQTDELEPISAVVERRFNLWIGRQKNAGVTYSEEQMRWLENIRDHIAANAEVTQRDLMEMPGFTDAGGLIRARAVFGEGLKGLLDELTTALVA
ncbi:MAG: DEAD/DEAH box helicase family protein [Litorimonas sp.]